MRLPRSDPETDAQLVARVQNGDAVAFGLLVRRYLQSAYAVALARLGEPADAEDVAQEAMITALERIDECRHPDRFAAWLLTIVRNRAHDWRRYRAVRETGPIDQVPEAASTSDPEREMENARLRQDLLEAMTILTETQREVLLLHDFEGWTHGEIAKKLGMSVESARVHLFKGRRALRARLADRYQEER